MFLKEPEKSCHLLNNNDNFQGSINSLSWSDDMISEERNYTRNTNQATDEYSNAINSRSLNIINDNSHADFCVANALQGNEECSKKNHKLIDDNDNVDSSSDIDSDVEKKDFSQEDVIFNYEDSDRTYSSADVTPIDGIYDFDVSDSDDSCMQEVNDLQVLPRGIHNPNYPGFQHLAYTLQEYLPQSSEAYENTLFSNVYVQCKDEEELLKLTQENQGCIKETSCSITRQYEFSDDDEGISTKFNDLDDSEYTRDLSSDSAISDNRDIDFSQDEPVLKTQSISTTGDSNIMASTEEFPDELIALRKEIYDVIQQPLATSIENISDVINTVIKHIVEYQQKYSVDIWSTLTEKTFQDFTDTVKVNMDCDPPIDVEDTTAINNEINFGFNSIPGIETQIHASDAYITNVKENLFATPDYEKHICEKSYLQSESVEAPDVFQEKTIKIDEMSYETNHSAIDNNLNNRKSSKYCNTKNKKNDLNQNIDGSKRNELRNGKRGRSDVMLNNKECKDYDLTIQDQSAVSQETACGFDVYNIETAMPFIDLDVIENHLKAAREEERRRYNDREEIRRRLALGSEVEEIYRHGKRPGRKPSLQARLQSGMNLQICFMNETASDTESPSEGEINDSEDDLKKIKHSENNSSKLSINNLSKLKNNNDPKDNTQKGAIRPSSLPLNDMARPTISFNPSTRAAFFECQARLQTEARMALAQAKDLAHMQMEVDRNRREISPITEMLKNSLKKAGVKLSGDRRRVSRQMLTDMNVTQLQVIVNELHTQIEYLNDSLVKLLIARDELHMGQDSMLVDIEDLTRYLSAKEMTMKNAEDKTLQMSDKEKHKNKSHLPSLSSFFDK